MAWRRRRILVLLTAVTCLCLPAAVPAAASTPGTPPGLVPTAPNGARGPSDIAGYYEENIVGPLALAATFTVPTLRCTKTATWDTEARLLVVLDGPTSVTGNANAEHGGGIEMGCTKFGVPSYSLLLCDPTLSADPSYASGCDLLASPVAPHDVVSISAVAGGGCDPTCSSVAATVDDLTRATSRTATSPSVSDFNAFVAAVGAAPLLDFGRVPVTGVTINGSRFGGQRANLVDLSGHTLARAGVLSATQLKFNVRWVRVQ
jgi:hypothetical protein